MRGEFLKGVLLCAFSTLCLAQSPYSGEELRDIKALSPERVVGYKEGQGLGYAKAAELNHYPGPRHVLDLQRELNLSGEQLEQTDVIYQRMRARAKALGREILDLEYELNRLFASQAIEETALRTILEQLGQLEAALRYVHLNAHLEQTQLLSQSQRNKYDRLRGYLGDSPNKMHHHSSHHHE